MAQSYSQGKHHGIHAFVVPIRSLEDHTPLPGVSVGDMVNTSGYNGADHGYLMLDNYRVPRDAMLMRYAKVEKDGTYKPPHNLKIAYGSLVYGRVLIVGDCARHLAQASCIATRYSAVRRQSEIEPGYLLKLHAQATTCQKLVGFMSYLSNPFKQKSALDDSLNMSDLIEAYEHRTARLIKVAAIRIQSMVRGGMSVEEARNKCSVQMVYAAKAHCHLYVVKTFNSVVNRSGMDASVARILQILCKLYAVYGINQRLWEFIQDGFLSGQQAEMILNKTLSLFAEIRPNAVGLVDAFDYPDGILQSCIGRYDGRVYEALYEYAKRSPLNKQDVHDSYFTTLKPLMNGKLRYDTAKAKL